MCCGRRRAIQAGRRRYHKPPAVRPGNHRLAAVRETRPLWQRQSVETLPRTVVDSRNNGSGLETNREGLCIIIAIPSQQQVPHCTRCHVLNSTKHHLHLAPSHRSVNHFDTIVLRTDGRPSSVAKETSNDEEKALVYHAADSQYTKKVQRQGKSFRYVDLCVCTARPS